MSEIEAHTERDSDVVCRRGETSRASAADRLRAELAAVSLKARSDFGLSCFWNALVLSDPAEDARLVAERLRRYGGRRGWVMAVAIDRMLCEAVGASNGVDRISAYGAAPPRP